MSVQAVPTLEDLAGFRKRLEANDMPLPATKDSDTVAEVFDHWVHQRRTVPNPSYEMWKETKFRSDLREDIETYC